MNVSAPFIKRPVATLLLALALAVAGVVSYFGLSVSPLPNMSVPIIFVQANLPGASPETMASSVAAPLQRSLGAISGVDSMSSSNSEGSSQVIIRFKLNKDVDDAAREVQAAINTAKPLLPSNMRTPPTYRKLNPSSAPIMALTLTSPTYDQGRLYDLGSTILAQKIEQIEGVGEVSVGGSSLPAVRIDLNPNQISAYGLSLSKIRSTVSNANQVKPRGFLENSQFRWQISTNDDLKKAKDYEGLVIEYQEGKAVRLKDIAKVYDSVENELSSGFFNDQQAITLIIRRQETANIIKTVEAIKQEIPVLESLLPKQVDLHIAQDRTPSIRATLDEAKFTLFVAIILVTIVVFIFLRNPKATLIPAISVPLSLLGTFVVMYFFDFSLNTISLMALIIATGFVVDDSIVVVENIARYIEKGINPLQAAYVGTKEVGFTVISMSLSLVVVFLPLLLVGDLIGLLFYEFAVTLSAAILVSLVISLTLTPMLCAVLLKKEALTQPSKNKRKNILDLFNLFFDKLQAFYKITLKWALKWRFLTLLTLLAAIILNVYLYITVPKGLFPKQDTGMVMGFFRVDEGTSFESMMPKLDYYRQKILEDSNVDTVMGYAGGRGGSNSSFIMIQLKPFEERSLSADEIINKLRQRIGSVPGSQFFMVARQDIGAGAGSSDSSGDYNFLLKAGDIPTLREWTPKVRKALESIPELSYVADGAEDKGQRLELDIDREKAKSLGVEMSLISGALNNLFGQSQIAVIYEEANQYHVVMQAEKSFATDPSVLKDIVLINDEGDKIPLSSLTQLKTASAPMRINHQDGLIADSIAFSLEPKVALDEASRLIDEAMQRINLPTKQIQAGFDGDADTFQKMSQQQPLMLLGVLILLYIVLGVLYESYIHPITILSTLPSAGLGALLALLLVKMEFTIIALIGVFLLMGIVKKNAIILIDFALYRQRESNLSPEEAIFEACLIRFRPILMTTLAAMFGALPLIVATGAGVELRQPLGVTIVGGLLLSQILTLYTTPVVYLYLDALSNKTKNGFRYLTKRNK